MCVTILFSKVNTKILIDFMYRRFIHLNHFSSTFLKYRYMLSEADFMQPFSRANMADGDDTRGLASPAEGKIKSF